MDTIIFAIWFFLPAGVANAVPILAAKTPVISRFSQPLDLGKNYKGIRILGANKTWRGLVAGILAAIIVVYAQQLINQEYYLSFIPEYAKNYLVASPVILGFLFGAGALIGDAVESFFKRQKRIAAGKPWFPYDQLDYILGGCLAVALIVRLNAFDYAAIFAFWFVMHLLFSYIGYLLNLKRAPI